MTISVFNDPTAADRARVKNRKRVRNKMRSATIREFGGGWNEVDAPVGLSTRFAKVLKNWYRKADGTQSIRYGTQFKTNIAAEKIDRVPHGTRHIAATGTEALGDATANGKHFGFRFTAAGGTTFSDQIEVFIESDTVTVGGTFIAAVYTDAGGSAPDVIIGAASPPVVIATGTPGIHKFVPVPGADFAIGTPYWIVFSETTTTANILFDIVPGQPANQSGKADTVAGILFDTFTGAADLRCQVNLFNDINGTRIVNIDYLSDKLISVTDEGEVITTDASYNSVSIFDDGVARSLFGAPDAWSAGLDLVSFAEIKGSLTIHNGVDKPLEIYEDDDGELAARYLQDLATGSNVNTPIGKYACVVSDYLCIAGIDDEESAVYIGAKGTVGTFQGDPAPNDGVSVDLGAYAPDDSKEIRGISSFRNYLFVHFLSATIQVILGEYNEDGDHVPRVNDTLQKFGLLAHRAAIPVVNDLIFPDISGVNTIKRNVLSGEVEPDRLSELIAPAYQNQVAQISQDDMRKQIFAVHDRLAGHYMLFVPTGAEDQVRCFVFTFNEKMRVKAWSEYVGWAWGAATSSALGRVFLTKDTSIYQYGNEAFNEEFSADFVDEYDDTWENNTAYVAGDRMLDSDTSAVYICLADNTSPVAGTFADDRADRMTLWDEYEGEEIDFDWELPWTDAGSRGRIKRLGFLHFDTQGNSQFNVDVFVDNIYKDEDDEYDPALTLNYTGGESFGYGGGDQPYGGGRNTRDERLWSHPVKFRLAKIRFHGATKLPLRVVSITELFALGRYGR